MGRKKQSREVKRSSGIESVWVAAGTSLALLVVLVVSLLVAVYPEDKNRPEDVVRQFIESSYIEYDPRAIEGLFAPKDIAMLREIYGEDFETDFPHRFDPDPYDEKGYDIQSVSFETEIKASSALVYLFAEGSFSVEILWEPVVKPLREDLRFSGAPYRLKKVDGQWYFDPKYVLTVGNELVPGSDYYERLTETIRQMIEVVPETGEMEVDFWSREEQGERYWAENWTADWEESWGTSLDLLYLEDRFRIASDDIPSLRTVKEKLKNDPAFDNQLIWFSFPGIIIQDL